MLNIFYSVTHFSKMVLIFAVWPIFLNVTFFHSVTAFFKRDIFHRVNHFFTVWLIFLHVTHVLQCDLFTEWPIFHSVTYFLQSDSCFVAYFLIQGATQFSKRDFSKFDPLFLQRDLFFQMWPIFYSSTTLYSQYSQFL